MLARETARMAAVFESGPAMRNCWELHRVMTNPTKQTPISKLGIPMWGSRAEQLAQTMGKFTREQLERGMKLIFEADRALRSPRPDDRIVMESFVAALTA